MNGLKMVGWGAIVFGILILLLPRLLSDLVAIFFILMGISWVAFGNKFK